MNSQTFPRKRTRSRPASALGAETSLLLGHRKTATEELTRTRSALAKGLEAAFSPPPKAPEEAAPETPPPAQSTGKGVTRPISPRPGRPSRRPKPDLRKQGRMQLPGVSEAMLEGMDENEANLKMKGISPAGLRYVLSGEWGAYRGIGVGTPPRLDQKVSLASQPPWIRQLRGIAAAHNQAPWSTKLEHLHGQSPLIASPVPQQTRPSTTPVQEVGHVATHEYNKWIRGVGGPKPKPGDTGLSSRNLHSPLPEELPPEGFPKGFDWRGYREAIGVGQADGLSRKDEEAVQEWQKRVDAVNAETEARRMEKMAEKETELAAAREKAAAKGSRKAEEESLLLQVERDVEYKLRALALRRAATLLENYEATTQTNKFLKARTKVQTLYRMKGDFDDARRVLIHREWEWARRMMEAQSEKLREGHMHLLNMGWTPHGGGGRLVPPADWHERLSVKRGSTSPTLPP